MPFYLLLYFNNTKSPHYYSCLAPSICILNPHITAGVSVPHLHSHSPFGFPHITTPVCIPISILKVQPLHPNYPLLQGFESPICILTPQ